jgi:hypothetical protein
MVSTPVFSNKLMQMHGLLKGNLAVIIHDVNIFVAD